MQSGNLLVITGKTFGITNIIALDADRNVIQDQRVLVEAQTRSRSSTCIAARSGQSYNCTPQCNPLDHRSATSRPYFDAISEGARRRRSASPSAPPTARSRAASGSCRRAGLASTCSCG